MQFQTLFDDTPAADYCREAIVADLASAQLSAKFRAYYRLRPFLPIALRQRLQQRRNQRLDALADWYIPAKFLGGLAERLNANTASHLAPWPNAARFAIVLTHDVETADGLRRIPTLAAIEEQLGFRSAWNIVPHKYPLDWGLIRDLRARGFEIGVHGYNHDGRLFWNEREFARRLPHIAQAAEQFQATGFRAPMVHRNLAWIERLPIDYDASCFDIDPYQAMPGGIGQLWPFMAGNLVELPYTMPQDHTLFVTLGETSDAIWRRKLGVIEAWSGMALLLTHPDYLDTPRLLDLYRGFLEHLLERPNSWRALPREVAAWWRKQHSQAPPPLAKVTV